MIAEEGSIGYIIDLLEDPEDARYNLKAEIEALKKTAKKFLESATAFKAKFAYWYLVIIHLRQTSLSKRSSYIGSIVKSRRRLPSRRRVMRPKTNSNTRRNEHLRKRPRQSRTISRQLSETAEVDRLRYAPTIPEPFVLEEFERVQRSTPMLPPPVKGQVHGTTE
jgi:hypothetical protein